MFWKQLKLHFNENTDSFISGTAYRGGSAVHFFSCNLTISSSNSLALASLALLLDKRACCKTRMTLTRYFSCYSNS